MKPWGCKQDILTLLDTLFFKVGAMIAKQAQNHVGRLKKYQFCQTYSCNASLMSC
jgi:hypothetical protein